MDGVLCDFFSAVQRLTDQPIKALSVTELWGLTRATPGFWDHLDWADGGRDMWELVSRYNGHILSSLAYSDPHSEAGKLNWLKNQIQLTDPARIHLVRQRSDKQLFALQNGVRNILIDDYVKNTSEWRAAGGIAILHTSSHTSLEQLRELGFD